MTSRDDPKAPASTDASEIRWAPRVSKTKLRRLYESEAAGLLDEALVDDVGITLYLRCQSILTVSRAKHGEAPCPRCQNSGRETVIRTTAGATDAVLACPVCSWRVTWREYRRTFVKKQLNEGGAGEYLRTFVTAYERARIPREKVLAIDRVIHEFHHNLFENRRQPTRAACVNLVEGKLADVVAFLNELACGDATAPQLKETKDRWVGTLRSMSPWHPRV